MGLLGLLPQRKHFPEIHNMSSITFYDFCDQPQQQKPDEYQQQAFPQAANGKNGKGGKNGKKRGCQYMFIVYKPVGAWYYEEEE